MDNLPTSAPQLHAPVPEYRLKLNNWLQDRGWKAKLTWDNDEKDGPEHEPTWHAACKFDGTEYGRSKDRTIDLAREEAARLALRRLLLEHIVLPLIKRRRNRPSP